MIERGSQHILKALREKFVKERDEVIEVWALEREQKHQDYQQKLYAYEKERYMQIEKEKQEAQRHNTHFVDQRVGRTMNVEEYQAATLKQLSRPLNQFEGQNPQ